jgi:hypothetical protein
MSSRNMPLLPRAALRSDSEQKLIVVGKNGELNCALSAVYSVFREEEELCSFSKYMQ